MNVELSDSYNLKRYSTTSKHTLYSVYFIKGMTL